MKILVTGSRNWTDEYPIRTRLEQIMGGVPWDAKEPTIMHGDCRGADKIAARIALELGYTVEAYPADWTLGRKAGPIRNTQMVGLLDPSTDLVLAFQLDGSRGTQHTITAARKRGVRVEVITA